MKQLKRIAISLFLASFAFSLSSQDSKEIFAAMYEEERESIEALVLYPGETRVAILEVSVYPELLVRVSAIQEASKDRFAGILSNLNREDQETIWDLTRYPGLVKMLVALKTDHRDIDACLETYPKDVHQGAKSTFRKHYDVLQEIDLLRQETDMAYQSLVAAYPSGTQTAVEHLLNLPEVLSILTENLRLAILAGDIYQSDPEWIMAKADSLHLVVARQQATDLADWKASIENDPNAQEEMGAAVEEYAEEYGYDDVYYDPQTSDDIYYEEEVAVIEKHYYHHYPYWFGYPTWCNYPRWRPYPVWWDWGFYYTPRRSVIVVGIPSFHFTRWYFHHPHHHQYYPHYSNRFVDHYYGHRHSTNSITVGVQTWQGNNQSVIRDDWLQNERNRVHKIRDFGRFESDRVRYNQKNVDRPLNQTDFHTKNRSKYPNVTAVQVSPKRSALDADRTVTTSRGKTEVIRKRKVETPIPSDRTQAPRTKSQDYDRIIKAKERHKQTWQKDKNVNTRKAVPKKRELPRKPAATKRTTTRKPVTAKRPTAKKPTVKKGTKKKSSPRKKSE